MRKIIVAFAVLCGLAIALVMWRLEDHDLQGEKSLPFAFTAGGNQLSGTIWLPDGNSFAAVVLVHGDGPQDRTSQGGYAPLVNDLLDRGIAVASWDKPGVGSSTGNWLGQTMEDRAREVRAALAALTGPLAKVPRGAIGFSQAGWVLPKLSAEDADFIVLVGPAVSWERQGRYYTRRRLELTGESESAIEEALVRNAWQDEHVFGANATFDKATAPDGMSRERWQFIRTNRFADATSDLGKLDVPTLAIWGQDDLNVDATADSTAYRAVLAGRHPANKVLVIPDATHGLLKAGPYSYQLVSQWPMWAQARFILEGRFAYAPGVLDAISQFIEQSHGYSTTK